MLCEPFTLCAPDSAIIILAFSNHTEPDSTSIRSFGGGGGGGGICTRDGEANKKYGISNIVGSKPWLRQPTLRRAVFLLDTGTSLQCFFRFAIHFFLSTTRTER